MRPRLLLLLGISLLGPVVPGSRAGADRASPAPPERLTYRGSPESLRLTNGQVEAIVVPAVGRVMSFRLAGGANVLWEDARLGGRAGDPTGREWINFGGDKAWPAPEAGWREHTQSPTWMPPTGFDGRPGTATIESDGSVILASAVDPSYGLRSLRRIRLRPAQPVMEIETTFERVAGDGPPVGIWIVTQLVDPVAVFVPVPRASRFPGGHFRFRDTPWPQLAAGAEQIRITRDPQAAHKLGSDAERLLWMGEAAMCLITTTRTAGAEYPDRGASVEVYTNPDPKPYVELETLGPLLPVRPGGRIAATNTYTLLRRTGAAPADEARRIFGTTNHPASLQPHPRAEPNIHPPGVVDRPELVPFIAADPAALPGIVVDDTAAALVGSWQYSTHTPPYVGLGYLHDRSDGKGAKSATFTPRLPAAGRYEVRLAHCANVRRARNAPVTIHHADGETTLRINQQEEPPHGRLFRVLGTFRFAAGTEGWVRISTEGTDGKYVIADAVQFLPESEKAR